MNIDLLFFESSFNKKEDFINNQEKFEEYISTHSFQGKSKELLFMPPSMSLNNNKTLLIGCQEIAEDNKELLELGYSIGSKLKDNCELNILNFEGETQPIILGILLSQYNFDKYQSDGKDKIEVTFNDSLESESILIKRDTLFWVKDLINTPAFDRSPEYFIKQVEEISSNKEINIEICNKEWLEKNNFGGVLGVAQGSVREPYFLIGRYNPDAKVQVALIGKGVLFDSGGLSLKSPSGMETMKTDMSGAATAWGAINLVAQNKIDIGLTVYTPLVENMPSGSAIRPGDVLTVRNGKTIEVLNTDAEGRLIMADALAYAAEKKPDIICDVATLTGAAVGALGLDIGAIFSNNFQLQSEFMKASEKSLEPYHPLPLYSDYKKLIESDIADMKNTGGRYGGAITAALLLEEFIDDNKWIHLDIAGPARSDNRKGATGFGVLSLYEFFKNVSIGLPEN
tara:strand:- start:3165 stop:4529 length:1365 start_codon:yes stop_codon:yes gene_type:complete